MSNKSTSEYEQQLERAVDRELKALPELAAPAHLMSRVLAAIAERARRPWYQQSLQMWPIGLQAAALLLLTAFFGGLCFGGWEVWHGATVAVALHKVTGMFSGVTALFSAAGVLFNAVLLWIKQLGTGVIIGLILAIALGYAMCLGLGTVYWKLAYSRT